MYRNYFNNALGIQQRHFSIGIVLIFVRMVYVNLIATRIAFNIQASSSHFGPDDGILGAPEMTNQGVW